MILVHTQEFFGLSMRLLYSNKVYCCSQSPSATTFSLAIAYRRIIILRRVYENTHQIREMSSSDSPGDKGLLLLAVAIRNHVLNHVLTCYRISPHHYPSACLRKYSPDKGGWLRCGALRRPIDCFASKASAG